VSVKGLGNRWGHPAAGVAVEDDLCLRQELAVLQRRKRLCPEGTAQRFWMLACLCGVPSGTAKAFSKASRSAFPLPFVGGKEAHRAFGSAFAKTFEPNLRSC